MTNHWIDIQNADAILIIGSNAAENHPMSMKWVNKARADNGAKMISVDPRFTRTSAVSDIYCKLRSGTDIAFIGGIIHAVLSEMESNPENYNMEYVLNYTNARFKVADGYSFDTDTGEFSDKASTWKYATDDDGQPVIVDSDVWDVASRSVLSMMKEHYLRYTTDAVCAVTGTEPDSYQQAIDTYKATGQTGKSGTIMYAMGTTQHTYGTQNVRSYAVLQLLLGNTGVAGGGINALRGESNVQGSTDHCLLFHILPGYLGTPNAALTSLGVHDFGGEVGIQALTKNNIAALLDAGSIIEDDLPDGYMDSYSYKKAPGTPVFPEGSFPGAGGSINWWQHYPKYIVSMLKAFYHDAATIDNEFAYHWLPKLNPGTNYSHISLFEHMLAGNMPGFFAWGQNPAVGGPSALQERAALAKLDWLVTVELWETETAAFWKDPEVDSSTINTEVWLLPAASSVEKEGSITNSGRWAQWRYKAVEPGGEAKDDLWIMTQLLTKLKALYAGGGAFPDPIVNLDWSYGSLEHPDPHKVAQEINGWDYGSGKRLTSFGKLKFDGSTCSGNWLYCGSYVEPEDDAINHNRLAKRSKDGNTSIGIYPNWSWCWPVNRRIIYNRASVDLDGVPWDVEDAVVTWNGAGYDGDVPDGGGLPGDKLPFIMKPEGVARLFGFGRADGPFPEHYEPWETPLDVNPFNGALLTPYAHVYPAAYAPHGTSADFPYVATTYRVTEHWQAGAMTRNLPWLVEAMPEVFVEISKELAAEKGLANGDTVKISSARGMMEAKAVVTARFKPFTIEGKTVHEVGIPWHWGFQGLSKGHSANRLTPNIGDCNTRIPEFKAFLCDITKA